jgi:hypothetical protein
MKKLSCMDRQVRPFASLPARPLPSPADACTPQCPTPAPTSGPAATFQGSAAAPPSSHLAPLQASAPSHPPPLCAAPLKPGGQSKPDRWRMDSGGSCRSAGSAPSGPSFRDVVLRSQPSSPASRTPRSEPRASQCRELRAAVLQPSVVGGTAKGAGAADGWQTVESRRSRRLRLKASKFQCPAPANLSDRCFNCFSPNHLVCDCRQGQDVSSAVGLGIGRPAARGLQIVLRFPQLFPSRRSGHVLVVVPGRASVWSRLQNQQPPRTLQSVWSRLCPPSSGGLCQTRRFIHPAAPRKVWRRKTSEAAISGSQYLIQGMASDHAGGTDAVTIRGRSRRRHSRKRRKPPTPPRDDGSRNYMQPRLPSSGLVPPCLQGWNHAMTVAEEDLRLAVVVSVISNRNSISEFEVASLLSPRLEIT